MLNTHSDQRILDVLTKRKEGGCTVVQTWTSRHIDFWGSNQKDFLGNSPFDSNSVIKLNTAYWRRWLWVVERAAEKDMVMALHIGGPGRKENVPIQSPAQAYEYGRLVGNLFKTKTNIIFNIGEDMAGSNGIGVDGWRANAEGVADGTNGVNAFDHTADYFTTFMTFHPAGDKPYASSAWFHSDHWLDANEMEIWHDIGGNYGLVTTDYNKTNPIKPILMVEGWDDAVLVLEALGTTQVNYNGHNRNNKFLENRLGDGFSGSAFIKIVNGRSVSNYHAKLSGKKNILK